MGENLPVTATRLRERMDEVGVSQEGLAQAIGCTQGAISQILTGATRNSRLLPKIAQNLSVNLNWLLGTTDEKVDMFDAHGETISEDALAAIRAGSTELKLLKPEQVADRRRVRGAVPDLPEDMVEIDELNVAFGMGATYLDVDHDQATKVRFTRQWLRHFTDSPPEMLFSAVGIGDSMYPTIQTSDVVLVDRSQNTPRMGDQIWAVAYGQTGMIKRLRPMPDGSVKLLSDNQSVPPETAYDEELHVIGRVVAIVRKV